MDHLKRALTATGAGRRSVVMQNQGLTVYDIHVVRYNWSATSALSTNESAAMALSTRGDDQVEDDQAIGFPDLVTEEGIYLPTMFHADELGGGSGGSMIILSDTIVMPKPWRVPYLAFLANIAVAIAITAGVEIFFERVKVSGEAKAFLVSEAGGRARTS